MEMSVAAFTVSVAVPDMPSSVALIVVVPAMTPRAKPVADTVATAPFDDVHCADVVTSWCDPSLSVATAEYATVPPTPVLAMTGVTAIDTILAAVTVIAALLDRPFTRAVMVALPGLLALTTLPITGATVGALELKAATAVRSAGVGSEDLPRTTRAGDVPGGMAWGGGRAALGPRARVPLAGASGLHPARRRRP